MKYCPRCRSEVESNQSICAECGSELSDRDIQDHDEDGRSRSPLMKWGILTGSVVAGLVIVLIPLVSSLFPPGSPDFEAQMAKFDDIGSRLLDEGRKIETSSDPDLTPIHDLAEELIVPSSEVSAYIKDRPDVLAGADILNSLAGHWSLIDFLIGGQSPRIAELKLLLIDLYPDYEEVPEAKRWLKLNGYDIPET